jgi:hypothetical protein
LPGNLTRFLTIKSASGHEPPEIHAFQTQGLQKSSMESLRGRINSPLLSHSLLTWMYQLALQPSLCHCKLLWILLCYHPAQALRVHQLRHRRIRCHLLPNQVLLASALSAPPQMLVLRPAPRTLQRCIWVQIINLQAATLVEYRRQTSLSATDAKDHRTGRDHKVKFIPSRLQAPQESRKNRGLEEHWRNGIGLMRKFKATGQGPFRRTSILRHKLSWSAAFMRTCNMS